MGRGGAKGRERASLPPDHWTYTDPDRHLWTPSQLAQAQQVPSRAAWEVMYGPTPELLEAIGASSGAAPLPAASRCIPAATGYFLSGIQSRHWFLHESSEFIEKAGEAGEINLEQLSGDDTFVKILWEQEWRLLEDLRRMGATNTAQLFEEREEEIKEEWIKNLRSSLESCAEMENWERATSPLPSLLNSVMMGEVTFHLGLAPEDDQLIREEIIVKLSEWSESDLDAFAEFAHTKFLPAILYDREIRPYRRAAFGDHKRFADVDREICQLGRNTLKALLGQSYADAVRNSIERLGRTGFFEGENQGIIYRAILGELPGMYLFGERGDPMETTDWLPPSAVEHAMIMRGAIAYSIKNIPRRTEPFLRTTLGKEVLGYLRHELPDGKSEEEWIGDIAGHFDDEIYEKMRTGEITALAAWKMALEEYKRAPF